MDETDRRAATRGVISPGNPKRWRSAEACMARKLASARRILRKRIRNLEDRKEMK